MKAAQHGQFENAPVTDGTIRSIGSGNARLDTLMGWLLVDVHYVLSLHAIEVSWAE